MKKNVWAVLLGAALLWPSTGWTEETAVDRAATHVDDITITATRSREKIKGIYHIITLILICIPLMGSLDLVGFKAAESSPLKVGPEPGLTLEFKEAKKHLNGQVSQAIAIHVPDSMKSDGVKVLFSEHNSEKVWQIPVKDNMFCIDAARPIRLRVLVIAQSDRTICVVHTDLVLFGNSETPVERTAAQPSDILLFKTLPSIELLDVENYYWHQTGIPLAFSFNRVLPFKSLNVIENFSGFPHKAHILEPTPDDSVLQKFIYIPAHDRHLNNAGSSAGRQDMLFTSLILDQTRYHLGYAFQLHRSRHAYESLKMGFLVLGIGIFVFTFLVLTKRRENPWWKE